MIFIHLIRVPKIRLFRLKKAFYLYNNRTELSKEFFYKRLEFKKNSLNFQRIVFELPQVNISKSWLLGFIEGDDSFSQFRLNIDLIFSIKLTESQLPLIKKKIFRK